MYDFIDYSRLYDKNLIMTGLAVISFIFYIVDC